MAELTLVEGWTGPISDTVKSNGTVVNLTGLTVDLVLLKADGTAVDTAGDVTVPTPTTGVVIYNPDPTDLKASETPHVARWKITDVGGKVIFFPSQVGDVWTILPSAGLTLQSNALLTLGEMRRALMLKNNDQDLTLVTIINAASDLMESWTGRRLKTQTYTDRVEWVHPARVIGRLWLDVQAPITAIQAIEIDGAVQTVWMPGDPGNPDDKAVYVLTGPDPKHDRDALYRTAGWVGGERVKWTYTAGYGATSPAFMPPIPEELKQAIIVVARDWYYLQGRQSAPVQSRSMEGETVTYWNEALPRQLAPVLSPYRRWAA